MLNLPLLSIITFLPLLGCLFIWLMRDEPGSDEKAKSVALFTSIVTFALSIFLYLNFNETSASYQFVEQYAWLPSFNINYHLGVDGISLLLILLTTFLMPLTILSTWSSVKKRVREYMIAFLVLETLMIGTFCALDLVIFYLFFEAVLIPMYIIIGVWGGERRIYASYKFFLYTLLGSVLMLVAMLVIYSLAGTTSIPELAQYAFPEGLQRWLWLAFFASFAVKMPMWPVHTWLPDAHVEAPTAGSVILAGVLLKMGGYGFIRFSLPMFPEASQYFAPFVYTLSVVAVVYTSLIALIQKDMKKLIAYSSVAHMGFVTLGIFTFTLQGMQGAIFQMISHGLVSAALFLCVGVIYDRQHTREIAHYGGLVNKMPLYAVVFMVMTLGAVGLPGTSGFVGEVMILMAAFQIGWHWAALAGLGIVLGAAYMLWLYRRVVFGEIKNKALETMKDLHMGEKITLIPIAILVIFFGFYPQPLLKLSDAAANHVLKPFQKEILIDQEGGE